VAHIVKEKLHIKFWLVINLQGRSQWPRGLSMNSLLSVERCDRGFDSNSRHGCLCVRFSVFLLSCVYVAALRRADHSSKESYRLCKKDYETEQEARA
jgi:hypothetical protein